MSQWISVCNIDDLIPGTGVCALVEGQQIAISRPHLSEDLFAISNMDPFAHSNVLSRGIICEHDDELWIASPLKKQRFALKDGRCLENADASVKSYSIKVENGDVLVAA